MKAWKALALSQLLASCTWGWNSWPSPPPKEPELENGQVGRAVNTMTYAPATLAGDQHLGVAFNRKLELVGREKLYDSPPKERVVGGFKAHWAFFDLRTKTAGSAGIEIAALAGIRGELSLKQGYFYAVYSFEEVERCTFIDEAVPFETPAKGRYFPVEICYGRRFSRVFSSTETELTGKMQAHLIGIPLGGGLERTEETKTVVVEESGRGLKRKEGCTEVNFHALGSVGDCFEVGPELPIRVRWRKIERRSKKAARSPQPSAGA